MAALEELDGSTKEGELLEFARSETTVLSHMRPADCNGGPVKISVILPHNILQLASRAVLSDNLAGNCP